MKKSFLSALLLLLFACASQPPSDLITGTPDNEITLAEAVQTPIVFEQSTVRWGGRVLNAEYLNTADNTDLLRVEVINYPLDNRGKPLAEASPGARFIAHIESGEQSLDELKNKVFKRNAFVTIVGKFYGLENTFLDNGQSQSLAIVNADDYYRWSYNNNERHNHGVNFGIGIGIRL